MLMILGCNDVDFFSMSICRFVPRLWPQWTGKEKNIVEWLPALANKLQNTLPLEQLFLIYRTFQFST